MVKAAAFNYPLNSPVILPTISCEVQRRVIINKYRYYSVVEAS